MCGTEWLLAILWLSSGGAQGQVSSYRHPELLIETRELGKLLSNSQLRLVDARPLEEYRLGHLPGAVSLPLSQPMIRTRTVAGSHCLQKELSNSFGGWESAQTLRL